MNAQVLLGFGFLLIFGSLLLALGWPGLTASLGVIAIIYAIAIQNDD